MLTKDQLRQLLDELPYREPRSSLAPYRELVKEMRRREYSYREISRFLAERCAVEISHNAVRNFLKRNCPELLDTPPAPAFGGQCPPKTITTPTDGAKSRSAPQQSQAVRERIAALKRRPPLDTADGPAFRFDPDQPLRLGDEES